jgi:hypothetical protein
MNSRRAAPHSSIGDAGYAEYRASVIQETRCREMQEITAEECLDRCE